MADQEAKRARLDQGVLPGEVVLAVERRFVHPVPYSAAWSTPPKRLTT